MPKIVVEGPDGRKFAFPDTMPRAEINAFMKQKYGTKAPNESVQDYLARYGREQAATEARVKDIDREATAVGRAEGERAAGRMGVSNPFEMAFAAPAIGLAQQEGGRRVFEREGTVLADEAAGLSAINAAGFFVPGMVNREFGARVEEGRRQQPLAAFAGDIAGGFGPGEIIGAGVSKAVQAIGPGMAALGRMLSRGPGPDTSNAIVGGTLGGIAPAETAEERARNVAVGAGLGYVARPGSKLAADLTTPSAPNAMPDAMPAGGYFGRQSMRPPGSGPSAREIELRQEWSTATPIVTQARTTAQTAQQAAEAALQSKAPADIARAKAEKKALVGQLQEAQASRAGMNTPEDARLSETLASLTENTSDPVLLSTQISAAKTSLDRLLTDIGSPVEGNLIPVRTKTLTRTQAPRSAAEGPQDRASVTRYAEGGDEVKPQGFGAGGSKSPTDLSGNNLITERRMRQDVLNLEGERAKLRAEAQAMEDAVNYGSEYTPDQRARFGEIDTRLEEIDRLTQETYTRYSKLGYNPEAALNEDVSLIRFVKKPLDQITPEDVAEYDRVMAGSAPAKSGEIISFVAAFRAKNANQTPPLKPMGFGASPPKTPQQAARFETPGSPEYEAAVAKGLDMSQAGRMARMQEQGYDTPLFHKTDADIEAFDPERGGRGATFFAGSPEGAQAGAGAGQNELRRLFARGDDDASGAPRVMPVVAKSEGIAGLTLAPAQKQYWQSLPEEMPLSDYERLKPDIDKNLGGIPYELYEDSYFVMPDGRKIEARDLKSLSDAEFEAVKQSGKEYLKKGPEPKRTYDEVKRSGRDLYGRQIAHYGIYSDEKAIANRYKAKGHTGYLIADEGGLSVAIFDPSVIRSTNAAFDPEKSTSSTLLAAAPFAAVSGAGLTSERELGSKMKRDKKD
jgi:hypothetical protein